MITFCIYNLIKALEGDANIFIFMYVDSTVSLTCNKRLSSLKFISIKV